MSYDEVVFKRSYLNLILLNRAIPGFKPIDENKKDKQNEYPEIEEYEDTTEEDEEMKHANDFFMNFM